MRDGLGRALAALARWRPFFKAAPAGCWLWRLRQLLGDRSNCAAEALWKAGGGGVLAAVGKPTVRDLDGRWHRELESLMAAGDETGPWPYHGGARMRRRHAATAHY